MNSELSGLLTISVVALISFRSFLFYSFISFESWFIYFAYWFMLFNLWLLPLELIICFLVVALWDWNCWLDRGGAPFLEQILPSKLPFMRRGDIARCLLWTQEFHFKLWMDKWIVSSQILQWRIGLIGRLSTVRRLLRVLKEWSTSSCMWCFPSSRWVHWLLSCTCRGEFVYVAWWQSIRVVVLRSSFPY